METDQIIQKQEQESLTKTIELNGKIISKSFMAVMPNSSVDFELLCEVFSPDFISQELEHEGGKEYLGAVCTFLNEHDSIFAALRTNTMQKTLTGKITSEFMLKYLEKIKLKIIDPNNEYLRLGRNKDKSFFTLQKLHPALKKYLEDGTFVNDRDVHYYNFWDRLFAEDPNKRNREILNLIYWYHEQEVKIRNADLFLPPVPYIKRNIPDYMKAKLLKSMEESNDLSYKLYADQSAFFVVIDADFFRDTMLTEQLNTIITKCKNKFIIVKILNLRKVSQPDYGHFARHNLESFLKTLKYVKDINPDRITGMLNGGGFAYSLFAVVFDFFTDTVSNYPTESFPRNTGKHRGLIHPTTFAVEPIDGVISQQQKYGALFLDNTIAEKYSNKDILIVDRNEWSRDCRKMGMIMWQKRIIARLNTPKSLVFDEVVNSGFSVLGMTVKNLSNPVT